MKSNAACAKYSPAARMLRATNAVRAIRSSKVAKNRDHKFKGALSELLHSFNAVVDTLEVGDSRIFTISRTSRISGWSGPSSGHLVFLQLASFSLQIPG